MSARTVLVIFLHEQAVCPLEQYWYAPSPITIMDDMLQHVLKPGRYINKEWNSIHKEFRDGMIRVALCFPDIYEVGMSHLGMRILYGILNRERDVVCERAFSPWPDMENHLRIKNQPIRSLESGTALDEFDIIGFSLQYELNYTDVLTILDLANIPLMAKERNDSHPIIIAGGPAAFNPEVMADFIDGFVIGEAEEAVVEVTRVVQCSIPKAPGSRDRVLKEMTKIEGVYVPGLGVKSGAQHIKRRIIKNLDAAYFPTEPVVPYIQILHDRISIEIMRGCQHRCKFCQARKIFHPLRIRSVERIMEIAASSVKSTGYEEISLLSLSSGDYPHIEELSKKLESRFRPMGVKISLPSLRVGSFKARDETGVLKRSGLTFAPEAGSERLRFMLDKKITDEDIIKKSIAAFNAGWRKVKLYFMVGLPGEIDTDLDAIAGLSSRLGSITSGRRRNAKNINLSINPFIPKPHSDFERHGMDSLEALKEKRSYLESKLRGTGSYHSLKIDFHSVEMARVEAILTRGDRNVGAIVFRAWKKGARLQAWTEYFNYRIWEESFIECAINPDVYLLEKNDAEPLPWSFIHI